MVPRSIFWNRKESKIQRLLVVGTGKSGELKERDFLKLGGVVAGKLNAASTDVTVMAEMPAVP